LAPNTALHCSIAAGCSGAPQGERAAAAQWPSMQELAQAQQPRQRRRDQIDEKKY
jgi:hypothetical protein